MEKETQRVRRARTILRILPIISFAVPFLALYCLYPASFEATWKGRTYYLFFLWLVSLETILSWEDLKIKELRLKSTRTFVFVLALLLPTFFVAVFNYSGVNAIAVDLARKYRVHPDLVNFMPLSIEYFVFAVLFVLIITLSYGIVTLKEYSTPTVFLGIIGMIYTIDNLYPFERFAPFQILVPATATLAANVLSLIGYQTSFLSEQLPGVPRLQVQNSSGITSTFDVAWPCSGVESLIIYTITILLFLKRSGISWKQRTIYFAFGAIVTYLINVLRIVTIYVISISSGGGYTLQTERFHNYYGQLYSITWIIAYPLIVLGSRLLWNSIRNRRNEMVVQRTVKPLSSYPS